MIIGLGNDLIDIRRIEKTLDRFGERFVARIFTAHERETAERRTAAIRAATYAKRYAAKEATAKALGTGFRDGVFWHDIGVVTDGLGRPTIELSGGALERLRGLLPPDTRAQILLTMSDEPPLAEAVVIISAVPA